MENEAKDLQKKIDRLINDNTNLYHDLHDCMNELCLKCENYKKDHLGACDDCRWRH